MFRKGLYKIAEYDREYIIRLSDLGIKIEKPSTEIYYSDLYELNNEELLRHIPCNKRHKADAFRWGDNL